MTYLNLKDYLKPLEPPKLTKKCALCGGKGELSDSVYSIRRKEIVKKHCDYCNGTGEDKQNNNQ